jgi:hypothetical protein
VNDAPNPNLDPPAASVPASSLKFGGYEREIKSFSAGYIAPIAAHDTLSGLHDLGHIYHYPIWDAFTDHNLLLSFPLTIFYFVTFLWLFDRTIFRREERSSYRRRTRR